MQYELWGRSRETKVYEFIEAFQDENQKYYMLDKIDPEIYYEAMILLTDWKKEPRLIMYQEYKEEKSISLRKRRDINEHL